MQFKETLIAAILIILVLFALLIFGNKLPDPISEWQPILVIICFVLLGLVVVFYIVQKILAVKSAMAIEKKLQAQASEQIDGSRPDKKPELQALHGQLNEALAALKSSKMGKGALYTLPWYMIIGPPGSGKTTALLESGLNFPYTSQGRGVKGVGGTRNCDWWFTDQGIMLDTAGRYTTELEDRDEWIGFLDMLKKCRKEKPINGVIVAISISDLLNATDEEMEAHSKNIRDRIDELARQLEMVFPVYLIFTKCDLLNGFTDFFEDFTKEDREQMWGMTLPYKQHGDTDFSAIFNEECKKFYETLRNQRVTALSVERKSDKKRNIYSFPLQFALAHKQLGEFVGMLFRSNPFQESPILRGVFMTSGTQEGFPIDQVIAAMSEAFGVAAESGGLMGGEGEKKSYFINNLFTKLIFPDQKLAQISSKVARRKRLVRWGMGIGSVAALALFSFLLTISFIANSALLAQTASAGSNVKESEDKGLATQLEALDNLRDKLETLEEYDKGSPPIAMRFGLYRGGSVLDKARKLYNQHLNSLFLKRLKALIQDELEHRSSTGKNLLEYYEDLYSLNYTYQILGGKSLKKDPKNPHLVRDVLQAGKYNQFNTIKKGKSGKRSLWIEALGGNKSLSNQEKRLANAQLPFYIKHIGKGFGLNPSLVNKVNAQLADNYWIDEKYRGIKNYAKESNDPPALTLKSLAGDSGALYLKTTGKPENQTVLGIFTQSGWNGYVKIKVSDASKELVQRLALMGYTGKSATDIENRLKELYVNDLKEYWNNFLKSIQVKEFQNITEASSFLDLLTQTNRSPFYLLFLRSWEERVVEIDGVKRNEAKDTTSDLTDDLGWWETARGAYKPIKNWLANFKGSHQGDFRILIRDIDGAMSNLSEQFRESDNNMRDLQFKLDGSLLEIVRKILKEPVTETLRLLSKVAKSQANELWKEEVYDKYEKMKPNYPFTRDRNRNDVTWDQFAELFGNRKEAGFFVVKNFVDVLDQSNINGYNLLDQSSEFKKASGQAIRYRSLYPKEDKDKPDQLSVTFQIGFKKAQATAINFNLGTTKIDGLEVNFRTDKLTWTQDVDLTFTATPTGQSVRSYYPSANGDRKNSPWALFRLIDGSKFTPQAANKFQLVWDLTPKNKLTITLYATQANNCFGKNFFKFNCPEKVVK